MGNSVLRAEVNNLRDVGHQIDYNIKSRRESNNLLSSRLFQCVKKHRWALS
jgi:hypothetical protein